METIHYMMTLEEHPKKEDTQILWEGLQKHAYEKRDLSSGESFAFFIKDAANEIKGGCSGYLF